MLSQNYLLIGLQLIIEKLMYYACNGILFNHESPVRGYTFVTQKIVQVKQKGSKLSWKHLFKKRLGPR